jgi:electron transfer flavoprotein alpha subunit
MNPDIYVVIEHLRGQVAEISYVMLAAARVLARGTGGSVVGVLLAHRSRELAGDLAADTVWYIDHPALADFTSDAYQQALLGLIADNAPRAVLFGDTSIGGDVAGWLGARLSLPVVSACRGVSAENGQLKFASRTCGGRIVVEGDLPGPTALVMMAPGGFKADEGRGTQPPEVRQLAAPALENLRVRVKNYVEPATGDADIAKERILVSVGRGMQMQDNLELARELARALDGEISASRPVVDQGWLPIVRLVGKSGKKVKPTVYLALGISGAPEHVEAITDSQTIIAVNTDPAAPIFDVARYGAQVDVVELLPVLAEKVRQARSVGA